ncbi:MAG: AAA family ATPase [Thermodesulfobacteriota bacterium]|nr:AAA family ATPase [Thermodesulfobacteriota bacterium]
MNENRIKRIPYGKGDFEAVNAQDDYYVDKTMFIPKIEMLPFVFLIRPRRFGKTLFLSMLHSYYDIRKKDRFKDFYKDTWIYDHPTPERGKYMILDFNFSAVVKDREKVQDNFNFYCNVKIDDFLERYSHYIPEGLLGKMNGIKTSSEKLQIISSGLKESEIKLYLLIDEYDNFANSLLAEYGPSEYRKLTRQAGYFKQFFTHLKEMASGSDAGLGRMFITGVSPVTLDDITSGFNIGDNISIEDQYNEILGFTEDDVLKMIDYYTDAGLFHIDKAQAVEIMKTWYGDYLFSENSAVTLFNTDAVLYFVQKSFHQKSVIRYLIDDNLRMDYGKLRYLIVLDQRLNGNFSRLKEIIENRSIVSTIKRSFPYEKLADSGNFISLLYFFGLLTFKGTFNRGDPVLTIPNETIQKLMYEYICESYEDVDVFRVDMYCLREKFRTLAYDGKMEPLFNFLAYEINRQTRIRDYLQGEKVIQDFFMAYFGLFDFYLSLSEEELNKGYADIVLKPFCHKYPDIGYGWLFEFKYIRRSKTTHKQTRDGKDKQERCIEPKRHEALEKNIHEKVNEARKQLAQYGNSDDAALKKMLHAAPYGNVKIKKGIVVFHGWELVHISDEGEL